MFAIAMGQIKYLIVAMDSLTKWIDASTLKNITTTNILKFFKRNILNKFGVPDAIITDNEMQFINKKLKRLLDELKIRQHFASIEHP